jgi:hypothetical protein
LRSNLHHRLAHLFELPPVARKTRLMRVDRLALALALATARKLEGRIQMC